jgi:hypothetical protein
MYSVSDWQCNFLVEKGKYNFRRFNSYMVLSIHLTMDRIEINQQLIHGNLHDITLLLTGRKLTTH